MKKKNNLIIFQWGLITFISIIHFCPQGVQLKGQVIVLRHSK